jgi:hypothetical protein
LSFDYLVDNNVSQLAHFFICHLRYSSIVIS